MALWKILRHDKTNNVSPVVETGEVYDDGGSPGTGPDDALDIETYLTLLQTRDGWDVSAEPV